MPLAARIEGFGLPSSASARIAGDVQRNVTAAGTTQSDAYQLSYGETYVATTPSGSGVKLAKMSVVGDSHIVYNYGANTLSVYPPLGDTIAGLTINQAVSLPASSDAKFQRIGPTDWVVSQPSTSAANSTYTPSGSGAVVRTVASRLQDVPSLKDFAPTGGDGTTDVSTGINSADAVGKAIYVPNGVFLGSSVALTSLDGPYWGDGQIKDSGGNKRAKFFSAIKAAPSSTGNSNSVLTAFNGDLSKVQIAMEHHISGSGPLSQPPSGYLYTPEAYARYGWLYVESDAGYNASTSTNDGRTAACFEQVHVYHRGGGDAVGYNVSAFVDGARAGATSFLAMPAAVLFNGGCFAGAPGVLLGPCEYLMNDQGYDVAGVGQVISMHRSVSTGALDAFWAGFRSQSKGVADVDQAYGVSGPHKLGLDCVGATISQAAVALKAGQKIAFNGTAGTYYASSIGGEYLAYSSGNTQLEFYGQSALQFAVGRIASAVNYVKVAGAVTTNVPGFFAVGSDTNVSIGYRSQGTGQHFFYSDGGSAVQFAVGQTASAVNWLQVKGAATGNGVALLAQGSDSNVSIVLTPQGTGIVQTAANLSIRTALAIPAGGTTGAGYRFSSTANFGVFFGSGAPTLTAAKGSLYLRSDGSGTTDRAYINTDGSTTWTALTTVA